MQVILSWNKSDSTQVASYNIYRGEPGKTFSDVPVNTQIVKDTFWTDSTVWPGDTLIYRVKPVSPNAEIGA